ncbi:hypothetical protein ACFLT2_06475 [Acidobacteriota bacterium]
MLGVRKADIDLTFNLFGQIVAINRIPFCHDDQPLDNVPQLPDISLPGEFRHGFHRLFGESFQFKIIFVRKYLAEIID